MIGPAVDDAVALERTVDAAMIPLGSKAIDWCRKLGRKYPGPAGLVRANAPLKDGKKEVGDFWVVDPYVEASSIHFAFFNSVSKEQMKERILESFSRGDQLEPDKESLGSEKTPRDSSMIFRGQKRISDSPTTERTNHQRTGNGKPMKRLPGDKVAANEHRP